MRDERTLLSLQKKRQSSQVHRDACRLCGVNSIISVGDFGRKNKYTSAVNPLQIPERAGVNKIFLADFLEVRVDVELDPQDGKSCRQWETVSFCSHINTNPLRQEADRRSKSKICPENYFEIDAILACAAKQSTSTISRKKNGGLNNLLEIVFTVPFNKMWTLKLKAQPTNACFATVNQMFSVSSQIPTTARGN